MMRKIMKSKKSLLIAITFATFVAANIFCSQEPQLSYWQRFKNWISGTSTHAQEVAVIPIEWAKDFISGFSEKEKIALAFALGVMTTNGTLNTKNLMVAAQGVSAALIGNQAGQWITNKYFDAKNLTATIAS